jgi:hypothetical protein
MTNLERFAISIAAGNPPRPMVPPARRLVAIAVAALRRKRVGS